LAKKNQYGFKTPQRRSVFNESGHKVGGELSGGECEIHQAQSIVVNNNYLFSQKTDDPKKAVKVFEEKFIYAAGLIFFSKNDVEIKISIKSNRNIIFEEKKYKGSKYFNKLGLEFDYIKLDEHPKEVSLEFKSNINSKVTIIHFDHGNVFHKKFISSELKPHYYNSKRVITIPEQFYLKKNIEITHSKNEKFLIILKSCNRCQRLLPINNLDERKQISFSNHCVKKAPCQHSTFSNYKVLNLKDLDDKQIKELNINDGFIKSYYGHQLECKACKKFFVNAPLNPLRSSTQQREDSLRRRAFELLIGKLLKKKWIYHEFRISNKKEFDVEIWKKFGKKCFKCSKFIKNPREMDLDHTMPLSMLYPLDKTATCLCSKCNSAKSDIFPVDFYSNEELKKLSEITSINPKIINSRNSNQIVVDLIKENRDFIINEFIYQDQYLKERNGKRVADSILHSLQKAIDNSLNPFKLI